MKLLIKILVWVCRIQIGGLFIFSGLIKANDALGFSYKLEEYFEVFAKILSENGLGVLATPLEWMAHLALPLSIFIVVFEIVLGILTILGINMRRVALWLFTLIIFFTFLTFVSWYWDLVKSCGCFGDFIPLTPKQSFFKDIYLLVWIIPLVVARNKISSLLNPVGDKIAIFSSWIIFFLFTFYAFNHLPYADYRAYAIGNKLLEQMETKKGNPLILYKLQHKQDGFVAEMASYPDDYQNWKPYVNPKDSTAPYFREVDGELNIKLIKIKSTGQENKVVEIPIELEDDWILLTDTTILFTPDSDPKITDLAAYSFEDEEDKIQVMLNDSNYRFVLVVRDLSFFGEFALANDGWHFNKSIEGEKKYKKFQELYALNKIETFYFSILTSEYDVNKIDAFRHEMKTKVKFYNCDDKELKTMIRASPGLFLWKKDLVLGKWHYYDFPTLEDIKKYFLN